MNLSSGEWISPLVKPVDSSAYVRNVSEVQPQKNVAYFRKSIRFPFVLQRCWLEFAARGDADIYWNDKSRRSVTVDGNRLAHGIVDISGKARIGENVLAIRIHDYLGCRCKSAPSCISSPTGELFAYPSDSTWSSNRVPETDLGLYRKNGTTAHSMPVPGPLLSPGTRAPSTRVALPHGFPQRSSVGLTRRRCTLTSSGCAVRPSESVPQTGSSEQLILLHRSNWDALLVDHTGNLIELDSRFTLDILHV